MIAGPSHAAKEKGRTRRRGGHERGRSEGRTRMTNCHGRASLLLVEAFIEDDLRAGF